jgi:hypothetical protein
MGEKELLVRAKARLSPHADVHVVGDTTTSYKCIGGIIYELQLAGAGKIGFIAESPTTKEGAK